MCLRPKKNYTRPWFSKSILGLAAVTYHSKVLPQASQQNFAYMSCCISCLLVALASLRYLISITEVSNAWQQKNTNECCWSRFRKDYRNCLQRLNVDVTLTAHMGLIWNKILLFMWLFRIIWRFEFSLDIVAIPDILSSFLESQNS
jgi:hypothetical protein